MEYIIETILEQVLAVVLSVIGAITVATGAFFVRWISARTKNEKLTQYAELLSFYAQKTVTSVAQTQADVMKKAAADGKINDEEKQELKAAAIKRLREILPDAILAFQKKANSDVDALLDTLVEAAVREQGENK